MSNVKKAKGNFVSFTNMEQTADTINPLSINPLQISFVHSFSPSLFPLLTITVSFPFSTYYHSFSLLFALRNTQALEHYQHTRFLSSSSVISIRNRRLAPLNLMDTLDRGDNHTGIDTFLAGT